MKTGKVSREVAEEQLGMLLAYYELEEEPENEDQLTAYKTALRGIVTAVQNGRLEITTSDNGEAPKVVQIAKGGQTINYAELCGQHKLAIDKADAGASTYKKAYALVGSMTNLGVAGIAKLNANDVAVAEALGLLFLLK